MKEKSRMDEQFDLIEDFLSDQQKKTLTTTVYRNDFKRVEKYLKKSHPEAKLEIRKKQVSQERLSFTLVKV